MVLGAICLGFSSSSSSLLSESSDEDSAFLDTTGFVAGATLAGALALLVTSGSSSESEELSLLESFFFTGRALTGDLAGGVSSSELESSRN